MKKLKKLLFNLRGWLKKHLNKKRLAIAAILFLVIILLLYYVISFFSVSAAEVCLERLRLSFSNEKLCHEDCAVSRVKNKKCVLDSLRPDSKEERKIKSYIFEENIDLDFRIFLIEIIQKSYGSKNPPLFLLDYFSQDIGELELKLAIFRYFDLSQPETDGGNPLDYYFLILNSKAPNEIKLEAAVKIASFEEGEKYYTAAQVEKIKQIIMEGKTEVYFRQSLVLLLGSYREALPEETDDVLKQIYSADFSGDNISRAFAADFLGEEIPEVSSEEWNEYYNHQ